MSGRGPSPPPPAVPRAKQKTMRPSSRRQPSASAQPSQPVRPGAPSPPPRAPTTSLAQNSPSPSPPSASTPSAAIPIPATHSAARLSAHDRRPRAPRPSASTRLSATQPILPSNVAVPAASSLSDDALEPDASPLSLTSHAVAAVLANATAKSPELSYPSSPFAPPPVISALSSSLRERSLLLQAALANGREQKDPPYTAERKVGTGADWSDGARHLAITPYAADAPTFTTTGGPSSSTSSSQLSSQSASPLPTPVSASPPSSSPRRSPSPTLPRPSLPRRIPQPDDHIQHAPSFALSSSAPVPHVYLPIEEDDEETGASTSPFSPSHPSSESKRTPRSSEQRLPSQSKASSDSPRSPSSASGAGITSLSWLTKPLSEKLASAQQSDTFKRSRRLSQTSAGTAHSDSPHKPSPHALDNVVFLTNAAETGYPGYEQLASHESLDYHSIHNELLRAELSSLTDFDYIKDNVQRWLVTVMIGACIGVIGFVSHFGIEQISSAKLQLVASYLQQDWRVAYLIYAVSNMLLVLIGSSLIVFFCPAGAGSGIPEVKGFLNGTAISRAMNVKTFVVKLVASITAVSSSLPVGPEGPMIHMGAMIGGGVSQPRSKTMNVTLPLFHKFHTDRDRRDFIAMGAACGVASAFGAPLGGVLFAIEEASSFWSQMLTWRTFFACMTATFFTNFLLSGVNGKWGIYDFSEVTEFEIGTGDTADSYAIWELLPFALMGAISGLTGGFFNWLSERMTLVRDAHVTAHPWRRLLEMVFLTLLVSTFLFFSPFYFPCQMCPTPTHPNANIDCSAGDTSDLKRAVQFMCPDKHYSAIATLTFTTEIGTVRHLFSRGSTGEFGLATLLFFFVSYFALALYSAGSAVAGGLLVPLLIIGASYGRLFGNLMISVGFASIDPGVYALIGAASFFSGVSRMTISLCIIMLEITNDLHYLPAIMLTVMMAKWVGDFTTAPIYESLLELKFVPFLDQEPPIEMDLLVSSDVMATRVKVVTETPRVRDVIALLKSCEHNGFPVVSSHPLHRPILSNPSNQHQSLGVPLGVPASNPAAAKLAAVQQGERPAADMVTALATPSAVRPAVAKAAAVNSSHKSGTFATPQRGATPQTAQSTPSAAASAASASSAPSSKRVILTAGSSADLGHGSGRVLRGLILRKQLLLLLQHRAWNSSRCQFDPLDYRHHMAVFELKSQRALIAAIEQSLAPAELETARLDLRPYMNRSPFSVHYDFHSVFCFRLFRSMGLRHLPVVNDANEVVGIITRKDIVHPIIRLKYDALLAAKEDGYIDFPGQELLSSDDDYDDDNNAAQRSATSSTTSTSSSSPSAGAPSSRSTGLVRSSRGSRKPKMRPALKAYSYLSPLESSPEVPGTPVYNNTPTLLSRPLLNNMSPKEAHAGHRHKFSWSSRLSTRV